ncbi:MAG TPA: FtsX-like permease family protein [Chitinophagaceae bacterium]|nr:FtsX-like permease family protein [Chitinophagaceae bacterium]
MNTSFYIARRLALNEKKTFSRFIIRLAILAVTLSVAVMIIGSAITRGYQEVIQNKFYDCWGHIHITTFLPDPNNINSEEMIDYDSSFVAKIEKIPSVQSINSYNIQSAILKTKIDIEGLLLKGIDGRATKQSIENYLIEGQPIRFSDTTYSNEILISKSTSSKLGLKIGDAPILYFLIKNELQPRARKIKIVGIYKTGLEDYDDNFAVCDAKLINHINQKNENSIHGYEVYIKDKTQRAAVESDIFEHYIQAPLQTYLIDQRFENVFSWLGMMKMNEQIIILIMLIIAIINMVTALLILVIERTQMVGVLKSIGMRNFQIQKIFIFSSIYILSIGLLFGTILGISLCLAQQKFGFLRLNEATYYVKTVPIYLDPNIVLSINLIAFIICSLLLLIPSLIVKTISPTKALKFN